MGSRDKGGRLPSYAIWRIFPHRTLPPEGLPLHKCHSIQGRESRDRGYCLLSKAIWHISPDKMLPPERKRTVLKDVGTASLFYCHLTRDSWTSASIRRMSQRDWMAFGSTWRFFHIWKHSVKLSTPRPTQSNWQNPVPQSNPS